MLLSFEPATRFNLSPPEDPMPETIVSPPKSDEYAAYYQRYIQTVAGDPVTAIRTQLPDTLSRLARLSESDALRRYAPGKWSIKQVIGHLSDAERIMAYRALRIARGDSTALPGFEENDYAETGEFDARPLAHLIHELETVRASSIALFEGLPPASFDRRGSANNHPVSVRALAYIIPGHELHHRNVLIEKYGLS
jgi:hypothetical protein